MPPEQIRVDFGTIDAAAGNMGRLRASIESHMADMDRAIAELQVWDGAAATECQARNQEIKAAWRSIEGQLAQVTASTNAFNADAQQVEASIVQSFSSR